MPSNSLVTQLKKTGIPGNYRFSEWRQGKMLDPVQKWTRQVWHLDGVSEGARVLPEETALALTYNGGTYAVMMGTPWDLFDFAIGFSLNEGVVTSANEVQSFEAIEIDEGIELRMWLATRRAAGIVARRRHIAGPTGCGLCGIDSIAEAVKPTSIVGRGRVFSPDQIIAAMASLAPLQKINIQTRAVHAAAFWTSARGIRAVREDVGRHNALDKLAGAMATDYIDITEGIILLTSRVSVELVQKAAAMGAPLLVAVSVPTALAIRVADAAGITLVAIARANGFEVFTHPHRVALGDKTRLTKPRRIGPILID
jgi:FdhD protein